MKIEFRKLLSICLLISMLVSVAAMPVSAATPTWTGKFGSLDAAYKNGYVGEYYGLTTFTKSNGTESVAGVDYQASSSAPFGADGAFTMVVGDWGYYEITAPYTGVYAMQLSTAWIGGDGATTVHITTDEDYLAQFNLTQTAWSSGCNQDQPLYLKEGKNIIKIELMGNNNAIINALDMGRLDAQGAEKSLDFLPLVKSVDSPVQLPTPTPVPSPTPEPTEAPLTWPGEYNECGSAYKNGYTSTVGDIKAAIRNGEAAVAGVDYQASSGAPFDAYGKFTMIAGDWAYINVDMPYTGVYVMQIKTDWSSNTPVQWQVTTEEGYEANYNVTTWGWSSGCQQDQPIYLKKGVNTIKLALNGNANATVSCIDFGRLDASGAEKSLDYLPLVKVTGAPEATPTPTPAPTPTPTAAPITKWIGNVKAEPAFNGYIGGFGMDEITGEVNMDESHLSGADFTMVNGEFATYTFNAPYTGVYGMQLLVKSIGGNTTIRVTSGDYYADFNLTQTGWTNGPMYQDQPLYFTEGENTLIIENIGTYAVMLSETDFGRLDKAPYDSTEYMQFVKELADIPVATPVPTNAPTPVPTAKPTPTPTPTPNITDSEYMITIEAESCTPTTGISHTTYDGADVIKATSESVSTYTVSVPDNGLYNLYFRGAAWKDVSVEIVVDGVTLSYETMHFNVPKSSSSYPMQNEKIYSLNLTAGTHTISFVYFCDEFYFDAFRLENTSSRTYHLLYGFKDATTSIEAYNILKECGALIDINVENDTSDLFYPELSFWPMVGKDFDSLDDMLLAYNDIIANETTSPTVKLYNGSNSLVSVLPEGSARLVIKTADMPANSTVVVAEYKGNQMVGNLNTLKSTSTTVTCNLTNLTAQSKVKIMVFSDLAEAKPYSSTGVYKDIYVATNGKSSNDGLTPETPLASVAQALTKVKSYNSAMTGDIVVHVAPGVYRSNVTLAIDSTMGGMNGYKVIIKAQDPDNQPVLSGGEPLTGKWSKVSGKNYWVATTTTRETRALYVNGYQATLARSDVWYTGKDFIVPENPQNDLHIADGFVVDIERWDTNFPRTLGDDTRLQVVFQKNWANHRFPVEKVTYGDYYGYEHAYIYIPYPRYHVFLDDDATTSTIQPTGSFYLENSMDLLDAPGEFYFDNTNRKMYYYPYANEDMTTAETYCAITDGLMTINGVNATNKVSNIEFDGISFRYGAWDEATTQGAAFNQADELRVGDAIWYGSYMFPAQVTVTYADNVVFKNCEFACLGSSAVLFEEGDTNCRVTESSFHDISGTGVVIGSFKHDKSMDASKQRSTQIEVDNNIFRRCAQEYLGTTAIAMYYTGNSKVHHNDIADMPYTAITVGWGWGAALPEDCGNNVISYNKIQDVMQTMYDGSQIYTVGLQGNNQINDNYFIDPGDHLRGGLYLDQATQDLYFSDNVFTDAKPTTDRWLFARRYVQIDNCYGSYNHTDGKMPSTGGSYGFDSSGVTMENNNVSVTSWSLSAQRIMSEAGVKDTAKVEAVDYYPSWRTMRMLDVPADE